MGLLGYMQKGFSRGADRPAPIIADPSNRQPHQDFRLPKDPPHVIRIHQDSPGYVADKLFDIVNVEVFSHPRITTVAESFIAGTHREIELKRDTNHPVDSYATEVIGLWHDQNRVLHRDRIGWLPAAGTHREIELKRDTNHPVDSYATEVIGLWQVAKEIADRHKEVQLTARVHTLYRPHRSSPGMIQIEIWGIGGSAVSTKPIYQSTRVKQSTRVQDAIAKIRKQGIRVEPFETGNVILGDDLKYVLTHADLIDLMDKDQLTWEGIQELHREFKRRFAATP